MNTHLMIKAYIGMNLGFENGFNLNVKYKNTVVHIHTERMPYSSYHPYSGDNVEWKIENGQVFSIDDQATTSKPFQETYVENEDIFRHGYKINGVNNLIYIYLPLNLDGLNHEKPGQTAEEFFEYFISRYQLCLNRGFGDNRLLGISYAVEKYNAVVEELGKGKLRFKTKKTGIEFGVAIPTDECQTDYKLSDELLNILLGNIQEYRELRIDEKIMVAAKKQALFHRNYDLAIVLFGTAFEARVQNLVFGLCQVQGVKKLGNGNKTFPVKEVVNKNINELINVHLAQLLSRKTFKEEGYYKAWRSKAYEPRNKIIHRGESGFGEDVAKQAYEAIKYFLANIESILTSMTPS